MHSTAGYSFSPTATCRHPERGGGVQTITSKPLQNDIKILSFQVWKEGRREEGRGGERSTNKTVTTRHPDKKNDHFHWYCPESLVEVTVCITTNPFASPLSPSYFSPAFLSFLWFLTMCSVRCFPLTPSSSCSPCSFPLFFALLLFLIMYSAYFEPTCFPPTPPISQSIQHRS